MQLNQNKSRAQLDELTAQLHKAEQNLEVEAAARRRAELQLLKCQEDAKSAVSPLLIERESLIEAAETHNAEALRILRA